MLKLLRKIYNALPVIRELNSNQLAIRNLQKTLATLRVDNALERSTKTLQEMHYLELIRQDKYADPKRLNRREYQVFSQSGEDGIIQAILEKIGPVSNTFFEIGVGNGQENNTAFLLALGWKGGWIEGDLENHRLICTGFSQPIRDGRLKVVNAKVKRENINELTLAFAFPKELDVFSLDIDRNTYWVWEAITLINPRVVVIEYNATFPAHVDWKVEYDSEKLWNSTSYMGASLKALEILGRTKGYSLVACDLTGTNAFFVRSDLCGDHFLHPYNAETHYEPARYYLERVHGHRHCFSDVI